MGIAKVNWGQIFLKLFFFIQFLDIVLYNTQLSGNDKFS